MRGLRSNAVWYPTAAAVVTAAFLTLGGFLFFAWGQQAATEASPRSAAEASVGYITGRAYDEVGKVPAGLQVCAQATLGGTPVCTVPKISGEYTLEVPGGQYLVYSYLLSAPTVLAYYTTALDCEDDLACDAAEHTRIVVNVTNGATVDEVYPVDWTVSR